MRVIYMYSATLSTRLRITLSYAINIHTVPHPKTNTPPQSTLKSVVVIYFLVVLGTKSRKKRRTHPNHTQNLSIYTYIQSKISSIISVQTKRVVWKINNNNLIYQNVFYCTYVCVCESETGNVGLCVVGFANSGVEMGKIFERIHD